MDDPRELLAKIIKILDRLRIQYLVTGGLAVFVWGRPRFTADIDIVIELFEPQADALAQALSKLEKAGYIEKEAVVSAARKGGEFNFISPELGMKVDFWIAGKSSGEREAFRRRRVKTVDGAKIYFISPEDLILSKLRWFQKGGGERHLEDIRSVLKKMGKKLDGCYLKRQVIGQGLADLWKKIQN